LRPKTHIVQSEKLSAGTHTTTETLPIVPGPRLDSRHVRTDSPDDSPTPAGSSCILKSRETSHLPASTPAFADGGERALDDPRRPSARSLPRLIFAPPAPDTRSGRPASTRERHPSAHRPVFSRICNATPRERQIMARKPANPRARCRAHGGRKLELRTYTMYLTPFPASDGKSGGGGVRPVAQSSQMPPIAPGRRCRAECERAPRVKQHATRPGLSGGTAPGAGRCTGQLAGRCPASRPRRPSPSARGPSRADGAATLRLTIGHWCQQVICLVRVWRQVMHIFFVPMEVYYW
jgi:hypothetical protein